MAGILGGIILRAPASEVFPAQFRPCLCHEFLILRGEPQVEPVGMALTGPEGQDIFQAFADAEKQVRELRKPPPGGNGAAEPKQIEEE